MFCMGMLGRHGDSVSQSVSTASLETPDHLTFGGTGILHESMSVTGRHEAGGMLMTTEKDNRSKRSQAINDQIKNSLKPQD